MHQNAFEKEILKMFLFVSYRNGIVWDIIVIDIGTISGQKGNIFCQISSFFLLFSNVHNKILEIKISIILQIEK